MGQNKRTFINESGEEKEIFNRQARHWFFMLYDDNPIHRLAVKKFAEYSNSIIVCHDRSYDSKGELKKKHWHCMFHGNGKTVYWKWTIKDDLGLPDSDDHLFMTLSDLHKPYGRKSKPFTFDSYVIYCSHLLLPDKEVYLSDDFFGGDLFYAKCLIDDLDMPDKIKMFKIFNLIQDHYSNHEFYEYDQFLHDVDEKGWFEFALKKWHIFKAKIDQKNKELFY